MTDELVQFLTERLDADEALARAPLSVPWAQRNWVLGETGEGSYVDLGTNHLDQVSGLNHSEMAHIAHHDPARVLREVEAKRAIVNSYVTATRTLGEAENIVREVAGAGDESGCEIGIYGKVNSAAEVMEAAVRCLAAVYNDHPDYHEEWRP